MVTTATAGYGTRVDGDGAGVTDLGTLLDGFDGRLMGVVGRDGERLGARAVDTAPKYAAKQMFGALWRLISNSRAGFADAVTLTLRERSNRKGGDMLVAVVRGGDVVIRTYGRTVTMTDADGGEVTASCVSKLGLPSKTA